jgi:hypothetical protein
MSLLFAILTAAHANNTHHRLALDALRRLRVSHGEAWQRLFLAHHKVYLEGAKAPDTDFKDFRNHVLHPDDGYWGGAPEKVANWYSHVVDALARRSWSEAAYAAGVLGHYYTDPIQPLHTAQSEAENCIHRAVEWSIYKSYADLVAEAERAGPAPPVIAPEGPHWLRELVFQGAERAHRSYEKLIAHYDIGRGVVDPPAGLDPIARRLVGGLIAYAISGLATILERAIGEAGTPAPEVSLTPATLLAGLDAPRKLVLKRLTDRAERRLVESMYDELSATGRVELSLPADERAVRALYEAEVLAPRRQRLAAHRSQRLPDSPRAARTPLGQAAVAGAPRGPDGALAAFAGRKPGTVSPPPLPGAPAPTNATGVPRIGEAPRLHLRVEDKLEAAPSIGPRLAERLGRLGLTTVADLLADDPARIAGALGIRHITPETVRCWQDEARLVLSVPGLRGNHARLLVGAGYRTPARIATAAPDALSAAVLKFATTSEGARILSAGDPPDLERITSWIAAAASVRAA